MCLSNRRSAICLALALAFGLSVAAQEAQPPARERIATEQGDLIIFPIQLAVPVLIMVVSQLLVAILVFVLPLWSVHQRLMREKRILQEEHSQRVESMLTRMHQGLDDYELSEIPEINSALAGLETERTVLSRIPTWPWRPRTFTGFLSLIVLPLLLFLVQLAIENWLNR